MKTYAVRDSATGKHWNKENNMWGKFSDATKFTDPGDAPPYDAEFDAFSRTRVIRQGYFPDIDRATLVTVIRKAEGE
jgi:hypothetical protein